MESGDIRHGRLTPDEYGRLADFMEGMKKLPLDIRKMGRPRTRELAYRTREFVRRRGPGLVIIDHAKRIAFDDPRSMLSEGINQVNGDLKALMLQTDCCGILLQQRNAEGARRENPRPIRGDVYGGDGALESLDCCIALFVEETFLETSIKLQPRDDVLTPREKGKKALMFTKLEEVQGLAELIGLKTRFSKANRSEYVKREARFTLFRPHGEPKRQQDLLGDE